MADVTISNLTANATPLDGTELFEIVNADGNSRKETLGDIATYTAALAPQGTVTSVGGTGTVNGITLTGTVTSSGNLTLGGTLANVNLASQVTGTLPATNGGTGQSSFAVGDLLYASTTTALSKLAGVATGNALISGGVSTAPSWGKIGLTTHVSGTLPVANGGTGITNDVTILTIPFVIDGGGVTITTGMKGYVQVDFACTIQSATLLGDQSGSIVVDIFKCTYSDFDPPTTPASGNKITASAPPTITTAKKSTDSTLTGWTTTISAGDILAFNVNSVTTMTRVTLALKVKRT